MFNRISEEQALALEYAIDRRRLNHKEACELVQRTLRDFQPGRFDHWVINTYMALLLGAMGTFAGMMAFFLFRGALFLSDYAWKIVPWFFA